MRRPFITSCSIDGRPPLRLPASAAISLPSTSMAAPSSASAKRLAAMPRIGSTRWPSAVPTRTTSDPMWAAIRRVSGSVRTSAVPRPLSPARGFSMQLSASFDQRSPHRFVVTTAGATSLISAAIRRARGVSRPSCSPILNAALPRSVRIAWAASYMPALIRITQPSVRSRPATAATRWSLIPFWKSITSPSEARR